MADLKSVRYIHYIVIHLCRFRMRIKQVTSQITPVIDKSMRCVFHWALLEQSVEIQMTDDVTDRDLDLSEFLL